MCCDLPASCLRLCRPSPEQVSQGDDYGEAGSHSRKERSSGTLGNGASKGAAGICHAPGQSLAQTRGEFPRPFHLCFERGLFRHD